MVPGSTTSGAPPAVLVNGQGDEVEEEFEDSSLDEEDDESVNWKKRALTLKRRLRGREEELRNLRKRVMEAIM